LHSYSSRTTLKRQLPRFPVEEPSMTRAFLLTIGLYSLSLAILAPAYAADTQLLAGVATADLTPNPGFMLWGYSNRTGPATGTLDPLMAKAVVLKVGEESAAIVTLDLGRVPEPNVIERIRARTKAECGVANLFITASHTHSAPTMESTPGNPNEFSDRVGEKISDIIVKAARSAVPVQIGVGRGSADLAHNRRRYLPDGRVAMQWRNAEREKTEPVDKEFAVIRLNQADGKPLAVLFHYACHPVVLGPDNLQYSADFVGAACKTVTDDLNAPCLFLQGACGNLNPYVDKTPLDQGGVSEMQKMGRTLGELLLATTRTTKTDASAAPSLKFDAQIIPIRTRWDIQAPEVREVLSKAYGPRFDNYITTTIKNNIVPCTLTTLLVNDNLALVGMPGEIFVEFQTELKRRSPVRDTFLVGYTNGYHAYFPTIRDAAAGGYGGKTATYVEPGAGERLTDAALIELYKMKDQLHEIPRAEDYELLEYDAVRGEK
jgi:neutral ceramidase